MFVVSTASEMSRTSATRLRLLPAASGDVDEVMTMWYGWMVKVVEPLLTVESYAPVIVIDPLVVAVTPAEMMPAAAVTVVSPSTPPAPVLVRVIGVVESSVITTPVVSRSSAVSVRAKPLAISAVEDVKTMSRATTSKDCVPSTVSVV